MQYKDNLDEKALRQYATAMNLRARSLQCEGDVRVSGLRDCILNSGGVCAWCGMDIINQPFEIDHIISLTKGGKNTLDNLTISCQNCNRRKSDKHPARFASEIYAMTGHKTPLIAYIISKYDVKQLVQKQMFADEVLETDDPPPADDAAVPPYKW